MGGRSDEGGARVLLVDDARLFLELERSFLRRSGCEVLTAESGEQALDKARRRKPDAVVLNVNMPGMDGLACCRALKDDPATAPIPVILVSSDADSRQCFDSGVDAVVPRPVSRSVLIESLREFVPLAVREFVRVHVGLEVEVEVEVEAGEFAGTGQTKDLGEGGLFLRTRERFEPGDRVALAFTLPGRDAGKIRARGRVVRSVRPHRDSPLVPGVGVEFEGLEGPARKAISRFVRGREVSSA